MSHYGTLCRWYFSPIPEFIGICHTILHFACGTSAGFMNLSAYVTLWHTLPVVLQPDSWIYRYMSHYGTLCRWFLSRIPEFIGICHTMVHFDMPDYTQISQLYSLQFIIYIFRGFYFLYHLSVYHV